VQAAGERCSPSQVSSLLPWPHRRPPRGQARGALTVRAQVVSAASGQAGIDGAAELVRSRRPAPDSATRAETPLAVVTLRWEGPGGRPDDTRARNVVTDRPRLVASIEFLRN
jgi:hypothetical protein